MVNASAATESLLKHIIVDRPVAGTPNTQHERRWSWKRPTTMGEVRFDAGKAKRSSASA